MTILAALSYDVDLFGQRDNVALWFWKTSFERRYDVASNTRAVTDYKILLGGLDGPWTKGPLTIIREDLLECNRKQFGTLHRALSCLFACGRPTDVLTGRAFEWRELEQGIIPELTLASLYPRGLESLSPTK